MTKVTDQQRQCVANAIVKTIWGGRQHTHGIDSLIDTAAHNALVELHRLESVTWPTDESIDAGWPYLATYDRADRYRQVQRSLHGGN